MVGIIKKQEWLMAALKSVHDLGLPDSYIAAGAIRDTVWNYLHGYPTTLHQRDIDVVYFDASDMEGKLEKSSEEILKAELPNLRWEVVNQARAHLFKQVRGVRRPPVGSSRESIAYWSETATCVGVRLEDDGSLTVCAPHGLDDLMNLAVRPVPEPYQSMSLYRHRIAHKNWAKFWPRLRVYGLD